VTEETESEEWIEIEGKSKEDAVERACIALNTTEAYLGYEVLNGGKGTKIRARKIDTPRVDTPRVDTPRVSGPQQKIEVNKRETSPVDSEIIEKAKSLLEEILHFIDSETSVLTHETSDEIVLEIEGNGSGIFIGKHGQMLEALQHLISKMVKLDRSMTKRLVVDSEQYRARRRKTLEGLARRLASRAKKEGRPMSLEPMNAIDRRVLHLALENDRSVTTKSVGEGSNRKVVVVPRRTSRSRNERSNYSRGGERGRQGRSLNGNRRGNEGNQGGNEYQRGRGLGGGRKSSMTLSRMHDSFDVPPEPNMSIIPEDVDLLAEDLHRGKGKQENIGNQREEVFEGEE